MKKQFLVPVLLAAGLAVEGAQAGALAVDPDVFDYGGNATLDTTYGYAFTVAAGSAYTITALGVFDETNRSGDGLSDSHPVGLWNGTGSTLLASVTVPSGTTGSTVVPSGATFFAFPQGQWRFVDFATPVVLTEGTYLIGGFYPGRGSDEYFARATGNLGTVNTLSGITVTQGKVANGSAFSPPTTNSGDGYFGPSFLVEQAIVNPDLTVAVSGQSTSTTAVPEGPAGVFSFTARYCNRATSPTLEALVSRTRVLTNGNSLVNRDRDGTGTPAGGVGSELDFPLDPDYDDGLLAAGDCVDVLYEIGLAQRTRFSFNVDLLGVDGSAP